MLKKRLDAGRQVAFCLIDLDNFKAFNDRYGYTRGNTLIKATATIIEKETARYGSGDDFVGHIGGDDFMIITTPQKCEEVCKAIIKEFDNQVGDFYDPEDRANGHIVSKTRQGKKMCFPFMTISIAVVTNEQRGKINQIEIGEIAAELKEHAKSLPGSVFVVDRRRQGA